MPVWPTSQYTTSITISITPVRVAVWTWASWMGNISLRSQASSEDTDSSQQGDLDEDTGKHTQICTVLPLMHAWWWINAVISPLLKCQQSSTTGETELLTVSFPKMVKSFALYFWYLNDDDNNEETRYSLCKQVQKTGIHWNVNEQARTQTQCAAKNYSQAQSSVWLAQLVEWLVTEVLCIYSTVFCLFVK